jgi:hypothetical protein
MERMTMRQKCGICENEVEEYAQSVVLKKHKIRYYKCRSCGFIQTESPFWLEEAYSSPISDLDIGSVNRAFGASFITKTLILALFGHHSKYLDYGAGYGIFVRRMRDSGFSFFHYDKYCQNLFSKGFEANLPSGEKYELITAFEVFEHLTNPYEEVKYMAQFSDNIFFSTYLLPENNPQPNDWWYFAPDHGQHVSFYSRKSLEVLAARLGLRYCNDGDFQHLLSKKRIPQWKFRILLHPKISLLLGYPLGKLLKIRSLLLDDLATITQK